MVESFCERPFYLHSGDNKRLVDFWVRYRDHEVLLILDVEDQPRTIRPGATELELLCVPSAEFAAARTWICNWERMLPTIISGGHQVSSSLQNSILKFISEPTPLARIEQEFVMGDPILVRAAIFNLLQQGKLHAPPQLHVEPLSYSITFLPRG